MNETYLTFLGLIEWGFSSLGSMGLGDVLLGLCCQGGGCCGIARGELSVG